MWYNWQANSAYPTHEPDMQYSLRSLLIAFAVAGVEAAVFCSRFVGTYTELPCETIVFVVPVLFGATLMGLIGGRKKTGIARVGWWVIPPVLATIALVAVLKSLLRASATANGTRAALACKEFSAAEEAYYLTDWDHDGVHEYAPTLKELRAKLAVAGSKVNIEQGLADAEWPSTTPFHGYFFKIFKSQKSPMQYSLRSLLVSFAVAGVGAAVFCSRFGGPYSEPPPAMVSCVIVVLSGATLIGSIFGRKRKGIARVGCWLGPPIFAGFVLAIVLASWMRSAMAVNATSAAGTCKAIEQAQVLYHGTDWNNDGVLEYAATLKELEKQGLIEHGIADAEWPSTKPFHGYFFKILLKQKTPIKREYIDSNGKMTGGFALITWPARYGRTGIDQFVISASGTIYQADYGTDPAMQGEVTNEFAPECPYWCGCYE
jgi:hypothetical protein